MMKPSTIKGALLALLFFMVCGCGGGGSGMPVPDLPGGDGMPGNGTPGDGMSSGVTWGPRLHDSGLSPIQEAEDDFDVDSIMDALVRAAQAVPLGSSQSSLADNRRTVDEVTARISRDDDGNIVYEVTDNSRMYVTVPGPKQSQDLRLALFTDLIPGIEPDLTSYPQDVLGVWAWGGEVGAFWDSSPSGPVDFGSIGPTGIATYDGDAVGLHAADGTTTKFLADVEMVADFDTNTVNGEVDRFRSLTGELFGDLPVIILDKTDFSSQGDAFRGETTATVPGSGEIPGSGKWGARWSDGEGWEMGGTFGFAAQDGSSAFLGAFDACSCASTTDGNPDDSVSSSQE